MHTHSDIDLCDILKSNVPINASLYDLMRNDSPLATWEEKQIDLKVIAYPNENDPGSIGGLLKKKILQMSFEKSDL